VTRPLWAALSLLTLLLASAAAVVDPAPWLFRAVAGLAGVLAAAVVWTVFAEIVARRRRERLARIAEVMGRHPTIRGWDR